MCSELNKLFIVLIFLMLLGSIMLMTLPKVQQKGFIF